MRRRTAVIWHAASFLLAGTLFFFFVLPRWPELAGDIRHTWATVLRIVTGLVLGLTALPVLLALRRSRRPEFGIPQLALNLRTGSVVGHLLAAVAIIGTAVAEIWISIDAAGRGLFAVYGAAAAVAVLAAIAFYLAYAAELPPPPPKPLKAKEPVPDERADEVPAPVGSDDDADDAEDADEAAEDADEQPWATGEDTDATEDAQQADEDEPGQPKRVLLNKRPTAKR